MWNLLTAAMAKSGFSKHSENYLQCLCKPLPRFSRTWCPHPKMWRISLIAVAKLCFPRTSATIFLIPNTFLQLIMLTLIQMRSISSLLIYKWAHDSVITDRMRQSSTVWTSCFKFLYKLNIFHLWLLQNTGYIPGLYNTSLNLPYKQWFVSPTLQSLHCLSTSSLWVTTSL